MKVPDANLLLYALDEGSHRHDAARTWLEGVLSGQEDVGFAWVVLLAVLRLATRAAIFERPMSTDEAFGVVEGWLRQPCAMVLQPTPRHAGVLRGLLAPLGAGGNLVNDAHLAALALEHGGVVCSCDSDFARFTGVAWMDPLAAR